MALNWELLFDLLVAALLCATIFYAARLSKQLKIFRQSRKELEALMKDLSQQVERADEAVLSLRENANRAGRDLQQKINDGRALSDELDVITQSGSNLAQRLENSLEGRGKLLNTSPFPSTGRSRSARPEAIKKVPEPETPSPFSFAIRDPDFDADEGVDENGLMQGDLDDEDNESPLSRAEQELYAALKNRKEKTGGMS